MDRTLKIPEDRRAHPRRARTSTSWYAAVLVRPGRAAVLIDISDSGALIEIDTPLCPGTRVHVQLSAHETRLTLVGQVARCYVASVTADTGVRYHGAIAFDLRLSSVLISRRPVTPATDEGGEYGIPGAGTCATREDGQSLPAIAARDER